ncbi:ESX secretion-associated protein EspG [Mycobacterium sp. Dal123C01]|uniref:ESX secretion-associated protein EspG n=1 Tax=Mycobacterium sp. Dal123C01 TaxID=3457577 RepID=UPI00403E5678
MTAALAPRLTLTDDQLRVVASRVGVHDLPTVVLSRPRHGTVSRREAAFDRAARELVSRNLIVDGIVHPELEIVLRALQRPDRELAMRVVTPDGAARVSVVRRATLCALARRIGDEILLRTIGHSVELPDAAAALLAELPRARPGDIEPVGAPLHEMAECLAGTHDAVDLADRIRTLGADQHAALLLGTALASRQAFAEVVYFALADSEDRISRGPAAVALFYTKRGRLIGAPSASPTGELWTTLKAGSDHAFVQAIGQLVGLTDEGWAILDGNAR